MPVSVRGLRRPDPPRLEVVETLGRDPAHPSEAPWLFGPVVGGGVGGGVGGRGSAGLEDRGDAQAAGGADRDETAGGPPGLPMF